MAKPCKCDPHEICEECPEWIFTLADLIMCMMGLFVLLWVLKPGVTETPPEASKEPDQQVESDTRWLETVGEIRGGFGWVPDPNSSDPIDRIILAKRARLAGAGEKGVSTREVRGAEGSDPDVTSIRRGMQSVVGGRVQFPAGDATLSRENIALLDQIANEIRGHRNIVLVKGHASPDDFPDGGTSPQRMDLSLRRAQAAADYLIGRSVAPEMLRVLGCSTFEPVAQRAYNSAAQMNNRRVEVEATSTLIEEMQDRDGAPQRSLESNESKKSSVPAEPASSAKKSPTTPHS
jgi:chemotaxis protein MotB